MSPMALDYVISALVTLLVVVDPVGFAPPASRAARRADCWRDPDGRGADRYLVAGATCYLAAGVPHRRRTVVVFDRHRDGVRRAHAPRRRDRRACHRRARAQHCGLPAGDSIDGGAGCHHRDRVVGRARAARSAAARAVASGHRRGRSVLFRRLPVRGPARPRARRHRQSRAVAAAGRAARGVGGAIRRRRHPRHIRLNAIYPSLTMAGHARCSSGVLARASHAESTKPQKHRPCMDNPISHALPAKAFHIRAAQPADVLALMRLKRLLAEAEDSLQAVRAHALDWLPDGFGPNPGFTAYVAEVGSAIVGMATCSRRTITGWNGPILFLQDLFVEPAHRRCGIAEALMARVRALARA